MKKFKIYYDKNTREFAGANYISSNFKGKELKFIEIKEKDWLNYLDKNQEKSTFIENGKLVPKEIEKTLEQLKRTKIRKRKSYLKQQQEIWFAEEIPQDEKEKIFKVKQEIKEIEKINNKEDLENYNENF